MSKQPTRNVRRAANRPGSKTRNGAKSTPARRLADELVEQVLLRGTPLDDAQEALLKRSTFKNISGPDRAFARAIATVTLRRYGDIDAILRRLLKSGRVPKKPPRAATILRTTTAELVFLDGTAHAAVNDAVLRAEQSDASTMKGLVNAVARKIATEGKAILHEVTSPALNTPKWLWKRWSSHYGDETAQAIARAHLQEPPLDLTIQGNAEEWADRLDAVLLFGRSVRRKGGGSITSLPGFAEGAWWVQDAAATLPVLLMGDVAGKRVLDLCAAPGGKTLQLAAAGATVMAVDRSPSRLERLKENLARTRLAAAVVDADITEWQAPDLADAILLDAPCSATGTIRRHPDLVHLKQEQDIASVTALQQRLLKAAHRNLKPGGLLVYSTCSLEPEEGERQIAQFLAVNADMARLPISAKEVFGHAEWLNARGELRTLPHYLEESGGMDGFFIARLQKAT